MAENKKSVLLYCDIIHTVSELTNEEAGKLFKHYLMYINDMNPVAEDRITALLFEPIKQNLKRDLKKWEKKSDRNSEIAKAGWDKRKNANACERIKHDANDADKVTVTVTVKDKDIINKAEAIKNSGKWIEKISMELKYPLNETKNRLSYFLTKQNLIPEYFETKTLTEIKTHFINWLAPQVETIQKQPIKNLPKELK